MDFRIADTFTDSLSRLTGDEQKAVKMTAFDLQLYPSNPGFNFHKLEKAKDKNFWSVRVSSDIRLIVHKTRSSLLLCYVDHHDKAYDWAERRKLETHPRTGAAQLIEIREKVQEVVIPKYVETPKVEAKQQRLFSQMPDAELLSFGVPAEWLEDVRQARTGYRRETTSVSAHNHGYKPIRSSGRTAPVPGDDQCRRAAASVGVPLGEMDGLSSSRATARGGTGLQWPGASVRISRDRQDDPSIASSGVPGSHQSRCPNLARYIF